MTLPGVAGRSQAWVEAATQVRNSATDQTPLLVVGERGVGKLTLVKGVHRDRMPTGRLAIVECEHASQHALAGMLESHQNLAQTVVFRHLDSLPPERFDEMSALLAGLAQQQPRPWIVATAGAPVEALEPLLAHLDATVAVPPLRHRLEDLLELVPTLLNQLAPKRGPTAPMPRCASCPETSRQET